MNQCRLLVVGRAKDLQAFREQEDWPKEFEEIEPLEFSNTRASWQFSTSQAPLESLRLLASRWPLLTFLVDYDTGRLKGLAWLRGGALDLHEVVYRGGAA